MPKRRLHHLILLLTLIFGSVAPAWAGTGSQEAGRLTWVNSRSSLHLFVSKSFKQVGVVEIDDTKREVALALASLLPNPVGAGADLIATADALRNGDLMGASLSVLSAIPFAGDLAAFKRLESILSKLKGKLKRDPPEIKGKCPNPPGCFSAGHLVFTREVGWLPIEKVQKGMFVRSRNEAGNLIWAEVLVAFQRQVRHLMEIHFEVSGHAEFHSVSPEHPYFVQNRSWVSACDLKVGDLIATASGWAKLTKTLTHTAPDKQFFAVFNMTVKDAHSYFVLPSRGGRIEDAIWVHNAIDMKCYDEPEFDPPPRKPKKPDVKPKTKLTGPPPGYRHADTALDEIARSRGLNRGELSTIFHRIKRSGGTPGPAEDNYINPLTGDVVDGFGELIGNIFQ